MAYTTYESESLVFRPSSTKSSTKRSTRQLFSAVMKALVPQVELENDYARHASNPTHFSKTKITMAGISFELIRSSSSSKESKRNIFSSILRHLAPQVEVDREFRASSANYASVIMARAH